MPKGTPTQVGMPKVHPHKPKDTPTQAATDPLRGSNQEWAQVDVNNPWPLVIFCIVSRHGLRWLRAASRGREAPAAGGEKVAETWDPNFFLKKMQFVQTLLGGPGGSWGSGRGSGGPIWLRSAHRWSSWAYFRRPGLGSTQFRPGWAKKRPVESKTRRFLAKDGRVQCKTRRFQSKKMSFCPKMDRSTYTRPSREVQRTLTQVETFTAARPQRILRIRPRMAQVDVDRQAATDPTDPTTDGTSGRSDP